MRFFCAMQILGLGALIAGCATVPRSAEVAEEKAPQQLVEERAQAVRDAKGFVAIGQASSLAMPAAQDRALRRARGELADMVSARVEALKDSYLGQTEITDPATVQTWFAGVDRYLRDLIVGGAHPVLEKHQTDEGLSTVWLMLVEDPGVIVQALEIRGAGNRQLFELVRASQAYRALLAEAETFSAYRISKERAGK